MYGIFFLFLYKSESIIIHNIVHTLETFKSGFDRLLQLGEINFSLFFFFVSMRLEHVIFLALMLYV